MWWAALFVICLLVAMFGGALRYISKFERGEITPKEYDPHYTRQLEQQEFGYKATVCGNDSCTECYPPIPPKGPGAITFRKPDYDERVSALEKTFKASILKLNEAREKVMALEAKNDSTRGRCLVCNNQGFGYHRPSRRCQMCQNKRVRKVGGRNLKVPNGVPDYAFAKIIYNDECMRDEVLWHWTNMETGERFGKRQILPDIDAYEIHAFGEEKPIKSFSVPPAQPDHEIITNIWKPK